MDGATGTWGIWRPGFCQFLTGMILFVRLTWLQVFTKEAPLCMAALAFTAHNMHWFAIGWNRYRQNDARPIAGMCVAYTVISVMGIVVFFTAGDWPVGLLFIGLTCMYVSFASIAAALGERALGLFHLLTGAWLMYLAFAAAVTLALGWSWPL